MANTTLSNIRNAIWGYPDDPGATGSITGPNVYTAGVNASHTVHPGTALNDVIYDSTRDIYLNQRTGMITTPAEVALGLGKNPTTTDPVTYQAGRLKLLSMRLRLSEGTFPKSFTDLHTTLDGDKVFVFIVKKGTPLTLEDDAGMFPSDTLITQIRLLME